MSPTGLLFAVAFASGCLLALVRHPIYGLVTYVGVFYLHPPSRWWGQGMLLEIRWSLIAAAVGLVAVLLHQPTRPTTPLFKGGALVTFIAFVAWIALQSFWALDVEAHRDLLTNYLKLILVIVLICRSIESEQHLRMFLWTHVLGCFYLGWIAFTSYSGGRFEGFGGPGINEANAAALQMVTGAVAAGTLFLAGSVRAKVLMVGIIPIIVNALVTTISRSGFLSAAVAGLVYNYFSPPKYRTRVRALSVLGIVLFALLTNPIYWMRIGTIKQAGAEVEGVDTGSGRLEIIEKQWIMFQGHPLGCGHMCTTVLSPSYFPKEMLSGGARASHNTFMTMLVDHGIVGGMFYGVMLFWILRSLRTVWRRVRGQDDFVASALPAVAAALGAITIGDMFVQYPKFEARFWFVGLLMVLLHLTAQRSSTEAGK